ncbi:MAG TPA: organomercurial lyase [Terriglobales bacterium]|nr:organomercurial lyase [Terriglobales bacterium]HYL65458.1 organomercurial lyase [Candidatus Methylomirabilis sp.]
MKTITRTVDSVWRLGELFWKLSDRERRIARSLYRLLTRGRLVPVSELARHAGMAEVVVEDQLARWPDVFRDSQGCVEGFWGLTFHPMKHRLIIAGRTAYTWCAWDTLFIPLILGELVEVRSACEATGEEISLRVGHLLTPRR